MGHSISASPWNSIWDMLKRQTSLTSFSIPQIQVVPNVDTPAICKRNVQLASIPVGVPSISLDMYTGQRPQQPKDHPRRWQTSNTVSRTLFVSGMQPAFDLSMLKFHFPKASWYCFKFNNDNSKAGAALTETSFR